jgi:hypothetical protein
MSATLKYNLQQVLELSFGGFTYEIPKDTCDMINYLCLQVGSCGLATNIYQKTDTRVGSEAFAGGLNKMNGNKKKKGNKAMEVSAEEWESIRTFQATKLEQKSGIDGDIDQIRLYLNKLTDKNFLDMRDNIISRIDKILGETDDTNVINNLGILLFDLCSSNKFYSKIFADMFAELASKYEWLGQLFENRFKNIVEHYTDIKYIDADKDYDGFCAMNKTNERRRALTTFIVNLTANNYSKKEEMVKLLKSLLTMIMSFVYQDNRKNEVDELTENVGILFNKEIIDEVLDDADDEEEYNVDEESIVDTINMLAKSKAKDYPSLSNKAIFKYMDLVEM